MSLEGSWYARLPDTDGGRGARRRLRFEGATYYLVRDSAEAYCAETGTFELVSSGLRFQPSRTEGFGSCAERPERVEAITWTSTGFLLEGDSVSASFAPIRDVPKVFVTTESHDGNLMGDPSLPGTTAIDKADALCSRSLARPDSRRYRAIIVDNVNRTLLPPKNWALEPLTTYFFSDGASNVFTTDRSSMSRILQGSILVANSRVSYVWTGLAEGRPPQSCSGWTANDEQSRGGLGNIYSARDMLADTYGLCSSPGYPLLCAGEGRSLRELADPAPGMSGAPPEIQGSWYSGERVMAPLFRTLRFDGDAYFLAWNSYERYCGEVGSVETVSGTLRLLPQRIEGVGACQIGEVRTASASVEGMTLSLIVAGGTSVYQRAPDVPKIFGTFETHHGDFANDASLPGNGAFEKADAFCNQSAARPDGQMYKAVLADGINRSAVPAVDWVLKPMTAYFYTDGVERMFQTDAMARQLYNDTKSLLRGSLSRYLWSGLRNDFTAANDSCYGWTSATLGGRGALADWNSFRSVVVADCSSWHHVICASQ
jgi:hypothetical protein